MVDPPQVSIQGQAVSNLDNYAICRIPTMEEIWSVVSKMGSYTSPGEDGYSPVFYKKCWGTVCNDVFKLVKEIFQYVVFPELLNHTNITLIPKIKNPATPSDYGSISLCNVLYKIVAKILSNKIKHYLDEFISWSQSAFVPGRQILDNILIAKELLHSMNNSRALNGHFALKVDIVEAYDCVNWGFLGDMLHIMGVIGKDHSLIMACVGYKINRWAPTITHLMFADDLFFFGEHSKINVLNLKKLLDRYASLSGQMTNYNKSAIYFSKGISDLRRQTTSQDLGVREMVSDDNYLGIYPLTSDYRIASFDYLVDKFNTRLPGWRFPFTNMAGRTVLLKTSLSSIPIYCMGICLLPKCVTQEIDKIMRCFWWGHSTDEKKLHFFNWAKVFLSKEDGGLGIRNMELMNIALVCKLAWRFLENEDAMWVKLMDVKYIHDESFWTTSEPNNCSSIWSSLLEVMEYLLDNVIWQISNGMGVQIWDNPWVPQIRDHIVSKPADISVDIQKVSDLILSSTGEWNMELLENIFSPEMVGNITSIYLSIDDNSKDILVWRCTPSGKFSTNSCYKQLMRNIPISSEFRAFPWKKLWSFGFILPKILIFIWKILNNGIAVKENIARFVPNTDTACTLRGQDDESVSHLLFFCARARLFFDAAGLDYNLSDQDNTFLEIVKIWIEGNSMEDCVKRMCTLWNIWKTRNDVSFSQGNFSIVHTLKNINKDFNLCLENFKEDYGSQETALQTWSPPSQPFIKINVDAAFIPNNGTERAIAQDCNGRFLDCVTITFG
ncbi:uncharacterized protein LOC113341766 [Papaver somniferum]|uniref:uncharacterized protein LOC113341766 n=1 Tax=Papaver somniferum TaxID=3469 RepID=UPI000E70536A|nr:uncharacterized protein LOC113341766 [Papaver somniferum]